MTRPGPLPTVVRPQEHLARAVRQLEHPDSAGLGEYTRVDWPALGGGGQELLELLPKELPFATSGTTGTPAVWWRARLQLLVEAQLLIDALGLRDADAVVSYAPTRHLYGFLFGCVVPALLNVPSHHVRLDSPLPRLDCARPVFATLPAAWWHLAHSRRELAAFESLTLVHSSARLPSNTGPLLDALGRRARLVELHGSTETGLVATRSDREPFYRLAADVQPWLTRPAWSEGRLEIRSPRLGRPAAGNRPSRLTMDDIVRFGELPRTFYLLGRHSRSVKVNGRRVDLARVESRLRDVLPGIELASEPVRDTVRGEWHEVLVTGGPTAQAAVAEACDRILQPWEAPRRVRAVDRITRVPEERKVLI